ncbi:MAG: hypothetical protein IJ082_05425 [Prevotella sp.]|nr:hypothetical protein [Prevotella sp.]
MDATKILLYLLFGGLSIIVFNFFFIGMMMLLAIEEKDHQKHSIPEGDTRRVIIRGIIIFGVSLAFIGIEILLYQIFPTMKN